MTTEKEYKIGEREVKQFGKYVGKWLSRFGIKNYIVSCGVKSLGSASAHVDVNTKTRSAYFSIGKKWIRKPTPEEIESAAAHEVIHVLLAELCEGYEGLAHYAYKMKTDPKELEDVFVSKIEEGLVVTFENFLYQYLIKGEHGKPPSTG
jgi:hypothetical protein